MKKFKIMALAAVTALSCTFSAFASSSVPTQQWYLGNGPYVWSAYVDNYDLYSDYYFVTYGGNFRIHGKRLNDCDKDVRVYTYEYPTGDMDYIDIKSEAPSFDFYNTDFTDLTDYTTMYFSINGSTFGAEASVNGQIETFLSVD